MTSTKFLEEMQRKINVGFKSQNPEMFDTVFEIDGKKLYANKLRLILASTTFESMLSDRWTSKNGIIPIKDYSFEDFMNFLTFLYTAECEFNNENIFTMLDMAEFYQIEHLKELCDIYLSKMKYTVDNIFKFIELSSKYSLIKMKKPIQNLLFQNFKTIFKCDEFLDADKLIIKEIVAIKSLRPEQIFQAIYEWAENRATKKQENSCNENFNMNDEIKIQMQEFLPNIKFKKMTSHFLQNFVVKKDFLFTNDELNDILKYLHSIVSVKVTNSNGQAIFGDLSRKQKYEIEIIKSLNGRESDKSVSGSVYWQACFEEPSTPLKKRDGVQWYLVYFEGNIGVERYCFIDDDDDDFYYLIAEMFAETDFIETRNCKIEIE